MTTEAPARPSLFNVSSFMGFQRQLVEFQKAAIDSTFDAVSAFQDQQEQYLNDMMERASFLPEEGREVVHQWVDTFRRGREDYKATVDKSFDLVEKYFDRYQDEQAETEE